MQKVSQSSILNNVHAVSKFAFISLVMVHQLLLSLPVFVVITIVATYLRRLRGDESTANIYFEQNATKNLKTWEYKSPSIIPFFPELFRTSEAPLGISLSNSSWLGLAAHEPADFNRWWKALLHLHSRKKNELVLVFLGGSTMAGHLGLFHPDLNNNLNSCDGVTFIKDPGELMPKCSFVAYFERFLESYYPGVKVVVHNWAVRACDSHCILIQRGHQIRNLPHIDVVFTHFKANDNSLGHFAIPSYEALVRFLLTHPSEPAVINIDMLMGKEMFIPHQDVTRHYLIPVIHIEEYVLWEFRPPPITWNVSFYQSVLPKCTTTGMLCDWDGKSWKPLWRNSHERHPEWAYHRALGDFISLVWKLQSEKAVRVRKEQGQNMTHIMPKYHLPFKMLNESSSSVSTLACGANPQTLCLLSSGVVEKNLSPEMKRNGDYNSSDGWVKTEDVPGKLGVWIDNLEGGIINFKVQVRKVQPLIGIVYLRSYNDMGEAEFYLDDDYENRVTINALNTAEKVSISAHQTLCLPNKASFSTIGVTFPQCNETGIKPSERSNDPHLFTTRWLHAKLKKSKRVPLASHNKFKILAVIAC